jgi:hypothetical protein
MSESRRFRTVKRRLIGGEGWRWGVGDTHTQITTNRMTHFCFGFRDPGFKCRTTDWISWLGFIVGFLNHSKQISRQHFKLHISQPLPIHCPLITLPFDIVQYVLLKTSVNKKSTLYITGRDSSVGIATDDRLDGLGIEFRWGRDFSHTSRPALGPTQPSVQWVADLSRG